MFESEILLSIDLRYRIVLLLNIILEILLLDYIFRYKYWILFWNIWHLMNNIEWERERERERRKLDTLFFFFSFYIFITPHPLIFSALISFHCQYVQVFLSIFFCYGGFIFNIIIISTKRRWRKKHTSIESQVKRNSFKLMMYIVLRRMINSLL